MDRRPLIYVAGPMNPRNGGGAVEYLGNCRRMIAASVELIKKNFAPFCPAVDMLYFLNGEWAEPITGEEIKAYSMAFLPVCQAILMMPGSEHSAGAQAEAEVAHVLNIPTFNSIESLAVFFSGRRGE